VTIPALVIVATLVLLLDHVPPVLGLIVDVLPIHIELAPVMLTVGFVYTSMDAVLFDTHPVAVFVK
jgi:hypothetical protein